jgi:hypothetical protein
MYRDRLYAALCQLYQRFHDAWVQNKMDKSRVYIVRYDRLMADFETVMKEMMEFLGDKPDEAFWAKVKATGEKQRSRKSEHKYDLATYGLSAEKIQNDLSFMYETFGLPKRS